MADLSADECLLIQVMHRASTRAKLSQITLPT